MSGSDDRPPLTDEDGEVREITEEDFKHFLTFDQLPSELQKLLRGLRGPQKAPVKQQISIRLSQDVLAAYRATGRGWQSRIDDVLRAAMPSADGSTGRG
jgi:uncharacterized protein (DUF4415 family)